MARAADPQRLNVPGRRKRSMLPKVRLDPDTFGRLEKWVGVPAGV